MSLPTYFPKTSSWKNYKRQLLELELNGASKEDINSCIRDSVEKSFYAYSEYVSREDNTSPALGPNAYDILGTAFEKVAVSVSPYSSESGDKFGLCVSGLSKETDSIHVLEAFEIQGDLSTLNSVLNLISKLYDTKCVVVEDNPDHFNLVEYLDCKGYAISKVRIKPWRRSEDVPHLANFMAWRFLAEANIQTKVQEYFCDSQPH